MEDEEFFKSPDGTIFSMSEAVNVFGDEVQSFIDDGQLVPTEAPSQEEDSQEEAKVLDPNFVYVTPDGTTLNAEEATNIFGDEVFDFVESGQLKKKAPYSVSSLVEESTDSTTPLLQIEDTLLESSPQLITQNNETINNIVINGVSLSEMSEEDQQQFYQEIQNINKFKERLEAVKDSPYGYNQEAIDREEKFFELQQNLFFEEDPDKKAIRMAAANFLKNASGADERTLTSFFASKSDRNIFINDDGEVKSNERKTAVPDWVVATSPPETEGRGGPEKILGFIPNPFYYSAEELNEIDEKINVSSALLDKFNINKNDFDIWEKNNAKNLTRFVSEGIDFMTNDSDEEIILEQQNYKKMMGYVATLGKEISNDLSIINEILQFEQDPEIRQNLLREQKQLQEAQRLNLSRQYNLINEFPRLLAEQKAETERRAEFVREVRNGEASGTKALDFGKNMTETGLKFIGGILGTIPSLTENIADALGFQDSFVSDIAEVANVTLDFVVEDPLTFDRSTGSNKSIGSRSVISLKPVTVQWEGKPLEVGVGEDGNIYDVATNVPLAGVLPDDVIKDALEKAKDVPNFENNWNAFGTVSGIGSTIVNLVGLIKGGKWATKTINKALKKTGKKVGGGVGMGLASYSSTVASEINEIQDQLLEAGVPYEEAQKIAFLYGSGRASLDGIFSGFAGGNTKLLTSVKSFPKVLKDLATKPGVLKSQVFKDKVKDLTKENAKELFIEELPVLISGDFLNSLANDSLGEEILSVGLNSADYLETVVMTLGATTGLGSKNLLKGNSRKDLLRIAAASTNIENDLNEAVLNGNMTRNQAVEVYNEVYSMQAGLNQTKGSVVMSGNIEQAASLLQQREKLMDQRKGLEGDLKLDIDKKIEDVDAQITALKEKDNFQAEAEKNPKTDQKAAINALINEGIKNPTNEQIYKKQQELVKKQEDIVPGTETESITETESKTETEKEIDLFNKNINEEKLELEKNQNRLLKAKRDLKDGKATVEQVQEIENRIKESQEDISELQINRDKLINKNQDAIQKQETGNISNVEQTKNTQKVEGKVRKPSVEAEKESSLIPPTDIQKKTKKQILEDAKKQGFKNINQKQTKAEMIKAYKRQYNKAVKAEAAKKAESDKQTKQADSLLKKIKKLIKKGKAPAEVLDAAKQFVKLNTNSVTDISAYIENANAILKGLTPSKTTKKGEVKVTEALDVKKVDQYTKKEKETQDRIKAEQDAKAFEELTGLDSKDFSLNEMRKILYNSETETKSPEQRKKEIENNKSLIKQGLKKAFNTYAAVVDSIIKTGVDPFTGQKVDLTKDEKTLLKRFLNLDIGNMTATEALNALDSMVNFATNQSTGGMGQIVSFQEGKQLAQDNEGKLEAKPLKYALGSKMLGNLWNDWIAQLPETINQMFKSQTKALLFEKITGFQKIRDGAAKGQRIANDISKAYYDKFVNPGSILSRIKAGNTKTMPNGKRFNDASNDVERGLFAFMRRTVDGTEQEQQKEFDRRKGLIEQSIEALKKNGQESKAELYQEAYDKLLKDSNNINDVDSKTDPINKEAVEWMTNEWTKARPELENVSLNIYNRTLGKDLNYTPDSFSRLNNVESEPELDKPLFQPDQNETIYDEETGVLKPKKPSNVLPMEDGNTSRFVNLGFDSVNSRNLESAYTDINTAPGIQQLKGFMSSSSYEKIVPNNTDRKLLNERFKLYVDAKRGLTKGQEAWLKQLNRFAGLGVSRVLGGPTQFAKQLVPLVNTAINLMNDPKSFVQGLVAATSNTDAIEWLNKSGVEIANRGIQAVTNLEGTDTKLENNSNGKAGRILDIINNAQKEWLQGFLIAPDKFAARASFLGYYLESLKKQGIDAANIDWKNHKSNPEALQYATQQTARQQNTSDTDLQGRIFSSKKPHHQIVRKIVLPFANFLLNQKTRMFNDVGSVFSKSNTTSDKLKAGKSLVGLVGETATFNALGLFITQTLATMARAIRGTDEDDETLEKQLQARIKGRAGQVVGDILSPIPELNPQILGGINSMIRTFSDEEDPFQFFVNNPETLTDRLGVLGIGLEKAQAIQEMVKLGTTGEYRDSFGRTIKIDPKFKNDIMAQVPIYTLYLLGALPLEAGSIIDYNMRAYKKTKADKGDKGIPVKKPKPAPKTTKRKSKPSGPIIRDGGLIKSGITESEGLF